MKSEWDKVIDSILQHPHRVHRNQELVRQYDKLLKGFEEEGFVVTKAQSYQYIGNNSDK